MTKKELAALKFIEVKTGRELEPGGIGWGANTTTYIFSYKDEPHSYLELKRKQFRIEGVKVDTTKPRKLALDIYVSTDDDYRFAGCKDSRYSKTATFLATNAKYGLDIIDKIKKTLKGRDYCCARFMYCLDHVYKAIPEIASGKYDHASSYFEANDTIKISVTATPYDVNDLKVFPEQEWDEDYEAYEAEYLAKVNKGKKDDK